MKKIIERLLMFFIGIPLVFAIIYIFPFYHHLLLHIIIILICFFSAHEMNELLRNRQSVYNSVRMAFLASTVPFAAMLVVLFDLPIELISITGIFAFSFLCVLEIFKKSSDSFDSSLSRVTSSVFVLLYPSYLLTFISRMTMWDTAVQNLLIFLLMVFACDSAAWLFGMLFGKGNRGFIAASPNKSIAGYVGGIMGSIASGVLGYYIFPQMFGSSLFKACVLALVVALVAIIGDLTESVFKRASHVKDSGSIIPGRGGLLDSIDSIILAAPAYYITVLILYGL